MSFSVVGNGRMVKEDGIGQKGLAEEGRSCISEVSSIIVISLLLESLSRSAQILQRKRVMTAKC